MLDWNGSEGVLGRQVRLQRFEPLPGAPELPVEGHKPLRPPQVTEGNLTPECEDTFMGIKTFCLRTMTSYKNPGFYTLGGSEY